MPYSRPWHRHFFYRRQSLRTTWKFRLAILTSLLLVPSLSRSLWAPAFARSLTCEEQVGVSDAILVDNLDQNYLLFERAAALHNAGQGRRVLVPQIDTPGADGPTVEQGIVDVMVRIAHLKTIESIPVSTDEPISLNVAYQVREYVAREEIRSITLVTTALRARRAQMVYDTVLRQAGVSVLCVPVFGTITPETWTSTWHGIQEVGLQFLKLLYYRAYVFPFATRP